MNWWSRHTEVLDDTKLGRESVSGTLKAGLGQYGLADDTASAGASDKRAQLELAQRKLARSVNVLTNTDQGEERTLSIGWSDGEKVNQPKDDTIWLSPADVLGVNGDKADLAIDALTGQSLLASTMKRTIHKQAWTDAAKDTTPTAGAARTIWQSLETAVARSEVLDKWEGFAPYFARHEAKNCASKKEVQAALDDLKPSLDLAAAALAWNILHPHDPLTLPAPYIKGINAATAKLASSEPRPVRRYDFCRDITSLLEIEPPPPPPPQPGPSKDDGEKSEDKSDNPSGEGKGSGSGDAGEGDPSKSDEKDDKEQEPPPEPKDKDEPEKKDEPESESDDVKGTGEKDSPKESKPEEESDEPAEPEPKPRKPKPEPPSPPEEKPSGPPPAVCDSTLFGDKVESKKGLEAKDIPNPIEFDQVSTESMEVTVPDSVAKCSGWGVTVFDEPDPTEYLLAIRPLATYIKAISESLRFRNNDPTQFIRGVHSGDLDEGSLDKLCMNEDHPAIWERREIHGQPKIAVGLLLDESGSMGDYNKIVQAKNVVLAMSAALARIRGISLMVLGHTANTNTMHKQIMECTRELKDHYRNVEKTYKEHKGRYSMFWSETLKTTEHKVGSGITHCVINEYLTVKHRNPFAIVHASSHSNNLDGYAMEYSVKKMLADYPTHQRRILFVISDGQPAGHGDGSDGKSASYGGCRGSTGTHSAATHMRSVCEQARRNQVGVYGIGIANAYDNKTGEAMYGHGNFVVIQDVMSSLPILTAYLRQIAARPT